MTEQDTKTPEGLLPADKKGIALWEWLKGLLKRAAEKLKKDKDHKDEDTHKAKEVIKRLENITRIITQENTESPAQQQQLQEEISKQLPQKVREYVEAFDVEGFIDQHHDWMIPMVVGVVEGSIAPEIFLADAAKELIKRTGTDKRIAKIIANRIKNKLVDAISTLEKSTDAQKKYKAQEAKGTLNDLNRLDTDTDEEKSPQPQTGGEGGGGNNGGEENSGGENGRNGGERNGGNGRRERDEDEFSYAKRDLISLKQRLKTGMEKDDLAWFDALQSPEALSSFFDQRVASVMNTPDEEGRKPEEPEARKMVSEQVTEFVMNALMTIYSPILDEEPSEFFDKQAQDAGNQYENPFTAAKTFSKMLNTLREKSKVAKIGTEGVGERKYSRLSKRRMTVKNDSSGQLEEVQLATTELENVDVGDFAEYLREAFDTGEGTVEFGHNFKLLTAMGPKEERGEPGSFFASIAGYAERKFTTDRIDTAFRLPYNHIVQAAKQKFQSSYARMLLDNKWQKDPMIAEKFLQSMPIAERRVKEELREQFSEKDAPDWAIDWAFQMGRTMYFGLDFGFHEIMSYADPDLKYNGATSFVGMGAMRGYFDMWEAAKMLSSQKKDLHLAKAVWLPYTINMGDVEYDSEKWTKEGEARWRDSFTMGQAAFAGSFLDGHKLFIDMGNITGVGGWGTNQGWRVREGYNTWLLEEFTGNETNRLEIQGEQDVDKFVNGWKRIENIGITITENFVQQYLIGVAGDLNFPKTRTPYFVKAVENLGDFFFDRYFSDGNGNTTEMGKELLKGYASKEAFRQHIHHVLTDDKHYGGSRKEELMSILHKVTTVQTFEQMPALFITMEKQRMTEYGVTLLSELQDGYLAQESGEGKEVRAKKRADEAIADIIYAQEKMRIEVSADMERNFDTNKNLYGSSDLSGIRSAVREGKGNVIDEKYIEGVVGKRYEGRADRESRINDAVEVYNFIKRRITEEVTIDDIRKNTELVNLEKKSDKDSKKRFNAIEAKVENKQFRTRAAWWAHALDDNIFGHAVTQPTVAMKFINVSAAGPDLVKRDAKQAADTAELMHTASTQVYGALKKGAFASEQGSHAGFEPLEEWIASFKGKVQGELGSEKAYEVSFRAAQLVNMFFKKDDAANRWWKLGPQRYWADYRKRSASDSLIDEGAPLWAWDHDTEHAWGAHLHHMGKLKRRPSTGIKHREIMQNSRVRKVLGKLPIIGGRIKNKKVWVHDHANTFSYHALQQWSDSGYLKLVRYHWGPALILLLVGLGILSAKKGSEDIEIT